MTWPVSERRDQYNRLLIWIEARDHDTGEPKPMGLWDGRDHKSFLIDGEARNYYGAGNLQEFSTFTSSAGLIVQNYRVSLAAFSPEVRELVRGRNVRFAPTQMHLLCHHSETGVSLGAHRIFKGFIDAAPEQIGAAGDDASVTLEFVSNARALTRKVPVLKSHAAQSKRNGDAFFKYADVSGSVQVTWGR